MSEKYLSKKSIIIYYSYRNLLFALLFIVPFLPGFYVAIIPNSLITFWILICILLLVFITFQQSRKILSFIKLQEKFLRVDFNEEMMKNKFMKIRTRNENWYVDRLNGIFNYEITIISPDFVRIVTTPKFIGIDWSIMLLPIIVMIFTEEKIWGFTIIAKDGTNIPIRGNETSIKDFYYYLEKSKEQMIAEPNFDGYKMNTFD